MAVIKHEIVHMLRGHVRTITIMRLIYYSALFLGFVLLVNRESQWLPWFGVQYDSLFMCMFVLIHFCLFKTTYYWYEATENFVTRKFEFTADRESCKSDEDR